MTALPCPFAGAILGSRFACENARRLYVGEGADIGCSLDTARSNCLFLLEALKQNAQFALKLRRPGGRLPHGKLMKLQCGGLLGLQRLVAPERAQRATVDNIHGLVTEARATYGSLQDLPYLEILKSIADYEPRRRSPRHR